ncbi:L,D-transpeptidase [Kribbella deserti]|uniref:Ig-like domain-containing protein n=1 Tax=Kribbella deserti TaxID=1926257 RepID=A0ABV6QIF5_9ACTN
MLSPVRKYGRAVALLAAVALSVTACSDTEGGPDAGPGQSPSATPSTTGPTTPGATTTTTEPGGNSDPGAAKITVTPAAETKSVRPDQPVKVTAADGTINSVQLTDSDGDEVKGKLDDAKTTWTSEPALAPGTTYTVLTKATGTDGRELTQKSTFRTLTAANRLKASMAPLNGETVGVGIPIQIYWNKPVKDKAAVEKRLSVKTSTPVEGGWYWLNSKTVHYRPKTYWPAGTKVAVDIGIQGVNAGNNTWGAASRHIEFNIGRSVVASVNVPKHLMVVRIDGKVARTIPITAGKKGFTTRSGVKVIMEKYRVKRMDARTVGIQPGDPEYYDIHDVQYAQRVTSSGEFVHGAPWSTGSQGSANVSHGCIGMSIADAAWYFAQTKRGDVVNVTGTNRKMEMGNGWADWNLSWPEYQKGSALS